MSAISITIKTVALTLAIQDYILIWKELSNDGISMVRFYAAPKWYKKNKTFDTSLCYFSNALMQQKRERKRKEDKSIPVKKQGGYAKRYGLLGALQEQGDFMKQPQN